MTPKDPKNFYQKHETITISLGQALALAATLLGLKILHAVALVFRIDTQTSPRSAVTRAIHSREQCIVAVFLSIVPESFYLPGSEGKVSSLEAPTVTEIDSNGQSLGQTNTRESQTAEKASGHTNSPLLHVSSSISPAVRMSQCLSDRGVELFTSNSGSGIDSMVPVAGSESIYSTTTMKRSTSMSRLYSRSSSMQQGMVLSAAQYAKIASERPRFSTASRPLSMESTDQQLRLDGSADQALLEMETLEAIRSVESFPGKFPISDGLEFSSLATAPHHMRGRGATSVRPFSDCN